MLSMSFLHWHEYLYLSYTWTDKNQEPWHHSWENGNHSAPIFYLLHFPLSWWTAFIDLILCFTIQEMGTICVIWNIGFFDRQINLSMIIRSIAWWRSLLLGRKNILARRTILGGVACDSSLLSKVSEVSSEKSFVLSLVLNIFSDGSDLHIPVCPFAVYTPWLW